LLLVEVVLGNDANSNLTAILVDIGGGSTDIAVVDDGGVEGTKMFGIGGRSFTKTIASELEISYDEAEKLKVNIESDKIKPAVVEEVNKAIDKTLEVLVGRSRVSLGRI